MQKNFIEQMNVKNYKTVPCIVVAVQGRKGEKMSKNLEESIKSIIEESLNNGTIEKIVIDKFEKAIGDAVDDVFGRYSEVNKAIKNKVSEVMLPAIESHDFTNYIVKLDSVLTDIIKTTQLKDNKKILENFKNLMIEDERKEITTSELFELWCKYVEDNVETTGLEVEIDDKAYYEPVECIMKVEYEDSYDVSLYKRAKVKFECEHDEDMNYTIPIRKWKNSISNKNKWDINFEINTDIASLRYLNDFEILLSKLVRSSCRMIIDDEYLTDDVCPSEKPELSY